MENLMKEYGSLVMTREGKRASIPLTTPEEADSILFGNEEMDKKVRAYIASVKEMDPKTLPSTRGFTRSGTASSGLAGNRSA